MRVVAALAALIVFVGSIVAAPLDESHAQGFGVQRTELGPIAPFAQIGIERIQKDESAVRNGVLPIGIFPESASGKPQEDGRNRQDQGQEANRLDQHLVEEVPNSGNNRRWVSYISFAIGVIFMGLAGFLEARDDDRWPLVIVVACGLVGILAIGFGAAVWP